MSRTDSMGYTGLHILSVSSLKMCVVRMLSCSEVLIPSSYELLGLQSQLV